MTGPGCYCPGRDGSTESPACGHRRRTAGRPLARLRVSHVRSVPLRSDRLGARPVAGHLLPRGGRESWPVPCWVSTSPGPGSVRRQPRRPAGHRRSTRVHDAARDDAGDDEVFGLGMTAASGLRAEEFTPPGPADFDLPPVGGGFGTFELFGQEWVIGVTKPMIQLVLGAILVFGFLYLAAKQRSLVPGRLQFAGEGAYGFVRNSVAPRHHRQPRLHALRALPGRRSSSSSWSTTCSPPSRSSSSRPSPAPAWSYGLALLSWVIYNWVGHQEARLRGLPEAAVRAGEHERSDPGRCWSRSSSCPT